MALPSSGQLTIEQIRAEFGGGYPVSISQYYRGGGLVPDVAINNSVPTSGQIGFNNFYGATAYIPDFIPDAFNINNINATEPFFQAGMASANSNIITVTGISEPITLNFGTINGEINASSSSGQAAATIIVTAYKNGVTANTMTWGQNTGQTFNIVRNMTVSVANNDTLRVGIVFTASSDSGDGSGGASANVAITNNSSSNTLIDSLLIAASANFVGGV